MLAWIFFFNTLFFFPLSISKVSKNKLCSLLLSCSSWTSFFFLHTLLKCASLWQKWHSVSLVLLDGWESLPHPVHLSGLFTCCFLWACCLCRRGFALFVGLGRRHSPLTCLAGDSRFMALNYSLVASSVRAMSPASLNVNPSPSAMHFLRPVLWSVPKASVSLIISSCRSHGNPQFWICKINWIAVRKASRGLLSSSLPEIWVKMADARAHWVVNGGEIV